MAISFLTHKETERDKRVIEYLDEKIRELAGLPPARQSPSSQPPSGKAMSSKAPSSKASGGKASGGKARK